MTTGETVFAILTALGMLGGMAVWIIGVVRDMTTRYDEVVVSVRVIREALLGNDLGHPGIVVRQGRMETRLDEIELRLESLERQGRT